jgi:hypothetical protein
MFGDFDPRVWPIEDDQHVAMARLLLFDGWSWVPRLGKGVASASSSAPQLSESSTDHSINPN